jgi:signal transduction histidine kinase
MAINIDRRGEPLFSNSGEVEDALRSTDWARTVLGPPETWPATMRAALSVCFGSRFPIVTYWGPELAVVYNSAYIPIFGAKHPYAMGMTAREAWGEIWDVIGPMLEDEVLRRGRATWSDDQLLLLRRHGFTEECYFTWSFSPIRDDDGSVIGVFTAVFETTTRVINDRRLSTLRELGGESLTEAEAASTAARALAQNPLDVPFAALYLSGPEGDVSLAAHTGIERADAIRTEAVRAALDRREPWHVTDPRTLLAETPSGPWPDPPSEAIVMPIARSGSAELAGALVLGISPRLRFDDAYRDFFALIAARIESELANARAYQEERRRAEALAELDRAKTMFFTNISHEFRTPLTLLLGPLEDALRDASLNEGDRERLDVAHRNAERLLRLVNNLLDFSRIEAGRVEAAYEATDVAAYTAELASMFRSAPRPCARNESAASAG